MSDVPLLVVCVTKKKRTNVLLGRGFISTSLVLPLASKKVEFICEMRISFIPALYFVRIKWEEKVYSQPVAHAACFSSPLEPGITFQLCPVTSQWKQEIGLGKSIYRPVKPAKITHQGLGCLFVSLLGADYQTFIYQLLIPLKDCSFQKPLEGVPAVVQGDQWRFWECWDTGLIPRPAQWVKDLLLPSA